MSFGGQYDTSAGVRFLISSEDRMRDVEWLSYFAGSLHCEAESLRPLQDELISALHSNDYQCPQDFETYAT